MDKEQKYTLDEARKIFAEEECKIHGHSWTHRVRADNGSVELVEVWCDNCRKHWTVVEGEKRGDR